MTDPPEESRAPARRPDRVSEVYASTASDAVFQRHLRNRINWTCRVARGPRVLDIGCSQGVLPLLLAREGMEVVGIDIEPKGIAYAQEALAQEPEHIRANVTFLVGDVFRAALEPGSFSTVIAGELLEHLTQPERLIERAHELLAEDGLLIVTTPFGLHPHPDHKLTFYVGNLLRMVAKRFSPERLELIHTYEGSASPAPILGVVARKVTQPSAATPEQMWEWLDFADRASGASDQRYRATLEWYEARVTAAKEQLAALQSARAEAAKRDQEVARARQELESRLRAAEGEKAALVERLAAARAEAAKRDQEVARARQELESRLRAAESEKAVLAERLAASLEQAKQAQTRIAALETEKTALVERLAAARAEAAKRDQEVARARQELESRLRAAEGEKAVLAERLAAAREQAKQGQARVASLEAAEKRLHAAVAGGEQAVAALRRLSGELEAVLGEAEQTLQALVRERDALRADLRAWRVIEAELRTACRHRDQAIHQLQRRLGMMEQATSYRLGLLLVRALQRPYRLLLLPFRTIGVLLQGLRRRRLKAQGKLPEALAPLPRELAAMPDPGVRTSTDTPVSAAVVNRVRAAREKARAAAAAAGASRPAAPAAQRPQPAPTAPAPPSPAAAQTEVKAPALRLPPPPVVEVPPGPVRGLGFPVAVILDEFSWLCYQYESDLFKLTPEGWEEQLSACRPEMLFVESVWFGNDDQWGKLVVHRTREPRPPLAEVINWCRARGIPTVFWNKEDPVHCDHFMEAARLFDFVFTTDADCIPRYRDALGHDRVHALPFAAQPMIHNPAPVPGGRVYEVAFAGSWHTRAHDARRTGADIILRPALPHGLHIYDRNFGSNVQPERYEWPPEFHPNIVGGVSYREMLAVYRQYKVFLNVNSVTQSPTMFSRRVFELLACGTPVISAYARGIEEMLGGDTVFMARTPEETEEYLTQLLGDARLRTAAADRGIRAVMSAHTYGHRLQEVVTRVGKAGAAHAPVPARADPGRPVAPREPVRAYIPPNAPGLCLPPPPAMELPEGPVRRPDLVVGAIVDEVFDPCWRFECRLVPFTPTDWQEVLAAAKPRFLFVDSAWRGNRHTWRFHIQRLRRMDPIGPSPEFEALIAWCKKQRIPTVFWNREDPPNYHHFIGAAKLCDYIFTTDSDCLPRYRADCGHDRIFVLPFAAQPRIHNPIASPGGRIYDLNFAGAWYAVKHDARREQMEIILRPALRYGVHIWDRRLYHILDDHFWYPEEYRPYIAGSLSYEETLAAMKQYRLSLNVNSVIESPTMCSCRVFEGLMAGSAVISGYARGIENLLGRDLVAMPGAPEETMAAIEAFLNDEEHRERVVHLAQRKILEEHTYSRRLDEVLRVIGLGEHVLGDRKPLASVVVVADRQDQIADALANYQRQTYPAKQLVLVLRGMEASTVAERAGDLAAAGVMVVAMAAGAPLGECLERALKASKGQYVAVMEAGDFYGPLYLSDLMLTFEFADAQVVGKLGSYAYLEGADTLVRHNCGREHDYVPAVSVPGLVAARGVFDKIGFSAAAGGGGEEFFRLCQQHGVKVYAADRFNWLARVPRAPGQRVWRLEGRERLGEAREIGRGLDVTRVTV